MAHFREDGGSMKTIEGVLEELHDKILNLPILMRDYQGMEYGKLVDEYIAQATQEIKELILAKIPKKKYLTLADIRKEMEEI